MQMLIRPGMRGGSRLFSRRRIGFGNDVGDRRAHNANLHAISDFDINFAVFFDLGNFADQAASRLARAQWRVW